MAEEDWMQEWMAASSEFGAIPTGVTRYIPPPRLAFQGEIQYRRSGLRQPRRSTGVSLYEGPDLVDARGMVSRPQYDPRGEAREVYANLSDEDKLYVFDVLQRKGFYGSRQPGVFDNDISAIESWLDFSNTIGYTWDKSLSEMQRILPDAKRGGGQARRYRVSSPEDLKVVAKRVAQETLGRAFTNEEADKFVSAYQQREMRAQQQYFSGETMVEAPSPEVFAQQYAEEIAPTEANGYKFLESINMIFRATGGQ
jgi:hypothetical protein